ncbi:MAG: O-antigen ligase family protein [Polaromonas sp.]|nr:O-antigen ligase family protein [Polaromonas sp.]
MPKIADSFRLAAVCLMAAAVGLPIAIISLSKAVLLLATLIALPSVIRQPSLSRAVSTFSAPVAIFAALAALALSVLWTAAPAPEAWTAWAKHAKLLLIPLLLLLVRNWREARRALLFFLAAQVFLLISSWLLWLGAPVPWATSNTALTGYAVFSSRLDQPIMTGLTAALCWHCRDLTPTPFWRRLALLVAALAVANVFVVMSGLTGHVVLLVLLSLAAIWAIPKPYRLAGMLVPVLLAAAVFGASGHARERMAATVQELDSYTKIGSTDSSSGERLNYWHRSLQSIALHPLAGSGVGSWNAQYLKMDQGRGPVNAQNVRNPHQEYLLWGVEAGLIGMALLGNILLAVWRDARRIPPPMTRSTLSVLAATAIACLFNSSLFDATIGDFLCVALALTLALGWHAPGRVPDGEVTA